MKTPAKVTLIVVATLAAAGGTIHLYFPGGLPAAVDKALEARRAKPARAPANGSERSKVQAAAAASESELRSAEKAYDAGEFGKAIEYFLLARVDADREYRARADRGLHKAVLAWALTAGAAAPIPMPEVPDAEVARRQAKADAAPSEQAWYDVSMYAAGCGPSRKLPFLAQQALDCAQRGGPVEARLLKILDNAGPRARLLREAMLEEKLIEPEDPVALAEASHKAAPKKLTSRIFPPGGKFTLETKAKLALAVEHEAQGTAEFELCGPDDPQRKLHRRKSLDLLKKARDIYDIAWEEDSDSPDLGRRLKAVIEMIGHLQKEMSLNE